MNRRSRSVRQQAIRLGLGAILGIALLARSAWADVTVAVVGPMSGDLASVGEQLRRGADAAVQEINAKGGLLGQKVTLITRDDLCDDKKAAVIAEELSAQRVALVDGHLCSGASIAASTIYRVHHILEITPSSTNPVFTDRGFPNVFRTCGRDDLQGFVAAEHIIRNFRGRKIAIIRDPTVYSRGLTEITKGYLNHQGIDEAFVQDIAARQTDFSTVLDRIKREDVRLVFFTSYVPEATAFLRQADAAGVHFRMLAGDTLMNSDFLKQAGRLADGVEITFPPDPADDRRNEALTHWFEDHGYKPEAFTFYSFAAVQIWAQAVAKSNSFEMAAVASALHSGTFSSVLGSVRFDAKGDISAPGFVVYVFDRGKVYYLD